MNSSIEKTVSKATASNGKTVELYAEMCSSWGYGSTKRQVVSQLVKELNTLGYDVTLSCEPMESGDGEFFVYNVINGNKKIIFSNNEELHKSEGAVIGGGIKASNVNDIIKKIIE